MTNAEIIVIGGGASGLMTARELSRAGKQVLILEGRNRLGGRIHTLEDPAFDGMVEAGAEFIHGKLTVTINLLKEAGLTPKAIEGEIWRHRENKFSKEEEFIENGNLLTASLAALKSDMSVQSFLDLYFREEKYKLLKESVRGYIEGYDAGDTRRASAFALRDDWAGYEQEEQYRVDGGYAQMIRFLEQEALTTGCLIHQSAIVREIFWRAGHVEIRTASGNHYTGEKVIITVPLGVLQLSAEDKAAIVFSPSLPEKTSDAMKMGFGSVIKILLQFKQAFWKDDDFKKQIGADLRKLGWLFSREKVPTWWTQLPSDSALLTGWLAGPAAQSLKEETEEIIARMSIDALAALFRMSLEKLTEKLVTVQVFNWAADPFSQGAYAYATVESSKAIHRLSMPVEDTIYFAGEALHDGPQMGTVEGALASGLRVAEQVLT